MNKERLGNFIKEYKFDISLIFIAFTVFVFLLLNFSILYINGSSMEPTYKDGNILVIKKGKSIQKDDIILFKAPKSWDTKEKVYIKRVIALGNDKLEINNNEVYVNNEVVKLSPKICEGVEDISITLKDNQYFVMGDNITLSNDGFEQYCKGNSEVLITKDRVILFGEEFIKFGGIR